MRDDSGELIYVGKAKSLKDRLRSYTHASAENSSRKVLRLVHRVRSIQWEFLPDEKTALLRENHLLRTHRPVFNVANTSPHTYLFVHLKLEDDGIRFHLGMNQDENYPDVFGAFKGTSVTLRAQKALYRILWATFYECRNGFEYPSIFTHQKNSITFFFNCHLLWTQLWH